MSVSRNGDQGCKNSQGRSIYIRSRKTILVVFQFSEFLHSLGHSRPSRFARNATYDRSCPKADIRAPTGLVLEIEIPKRLPVLSRTMKHASLRSSTIQGGGKRRTEDVELAR